MVLKDSTFYSTNPCSSAMLFTVCEEMETSAYEWMMKAWYTDIIFYPMVERTGAMGFAGKWMELGTMTLR